MTLTQWLGNFGAWSAQVAALVVVAAVVAAGLRLTLPRARLAIWQALLLACLALPVLQPWRPAPTSGPDASVATDLAAPVVADALEPAATGNPFEIPWIPLLAGILAAGALARLVWLGLGFSRLARYRRDMNVLEPVPAPFADACACAGTRAMIGTAAGLDGPVTFGLRRPLVLLPPAVLTLDAALQQSVVCHELLHVRRRDWIWSVAEEVVCALAWFHPAIWWLVAQIDLAREQHVDAEVVRLTGHRKPYLEALLYLASPDRGADLAPAPALLRRRHLAKRLLVLAREVSMSRPRIVLSAAVLIGLLTLTAGAAAVSFPLIGAPSVEPPAAAPPVESPIAAPQTQAPLRVGGNIMPPKKITDVRPVYPAEAREARIQGVVILEVLIGPEGRVNDAKVLRSIPELDQAALDAVWQWEFTPTLLNGVPVPIIMTITVNFTLAEDKGAPGGVPGGVVGGVPGGVVGGVAEVPPPKKIFDVKPNYPDDAKRQRVQGVVILQATIEESGLVSHVKVLRSIPMLDQAAIDAVRQWRFEPPPKRVVMTTTVRFSLDEFVYPQALYPAEALAAKVEGTVILDVVVGVSGKVTSVKLVDGPSLLAQSAIAALQGRDVGEVTVPLTWRIEIEYRIKDGKPSVTWHGTGVGMKPPTAAPELAPVAESAQREKPQPPRRVHYVAPVYPEDARAQKVQGTVILEVTIGPVGGIATNVKILRGIDLLNQAAIDAVQKWKWDPPALPTVAIVTVNFTLDVQAEVTARPNLTDAKLEAVHEVKPAYPPEAKEAKLAGTVDVEILVDETGRVASARVLQGADAFHQAALDAVRQWQFKAPGKRVKTNVEFTFTLR